MVYKVRPLMVDGSTTILRNFYADLLCSYVDNATSNPYSQSWHANFTFSFVARDCCNKTFTEVVDCVRRMRVPLMFDCLPIVGNGNDGGAAECVPWNELLFGPWDGNTVAQLVDIKKTKHVGHAKTLVESLNSLLDVIIVAGGDGTSSEVVTGVDVKNIIFYPTKVPFEQERIGSVVAHDDDNDDDDDNDNRYDDYDTDKGVT
uniref:DAGKc domain-containing protein n=1 Tax=Glossina pallidipes TaxID=7398 RepID=A0A1B0AH35_GLOPL